MFRAITEHPSKHSKENGKRLPIRTGSLFLGGENKSVKRPAKNILFALLWVVPLLLCIALLRRIC